MAKLVLAAGVPHPPRLVFEMQQLPGKTRGFEQGNLPVQRFIKS